MKASSEFYAFPEKDRPSILLELRGKREVNQREIQGRKADGSLFGLLISFRLLEYEGHPAALASLYDLTERKRVEQALRDSERRYRMVAENAADVIWTMDLQGKFTYISPSIIRLRGISPEDAMQESVQETMSPHSFGIVSQIFCERPSAEAEGRFDIIHQIEIEQYHHNGSLVWVEVVSKTMFDEQGHKVGYLGVSRDISKRKQVEADLRQAKEKAEDAQRVAEQANQAKSTLLANMSHELRTPLNGILGYTQILKRDHTLTERQMQAIDVIHRSGEYLLMLINDVLELAKIEAGKIELNSEEFRLSSLLTVIVDMMRMKADLKGLELVYKVPKRLAERVKGDPVRLRQVLMNLLGNAVKFTLKGRISFRVTSLNYGTVDGGDHSVSTRHPSIYQTCRFEVEDSGIGIPVEQLTDIFTPFEQVNDSRIHAEGTGLGLAISDQFVRLMGGEIQVESTPEKGSRFFFELSFPVAGVREEPQEHPPQRIAGFKGPVRTILIVDDTHDSRLVLRECLKPLGFHCLEAENGLQALEQVQFFSPDLIFLDLKMPVMDGYEMLPLLRSLDSRGQVPVVAFSAGAYDRIRQKSLEVGCNEFLTKPLKEDEVLSAIERLLGIEWMYDNQPGTSLSSELSKEPLILPPQTELQAMYDAVKIGDIMALREMLTRFGGDEPSLQPLRQELRMLCKNFRLDAIRERLEGFLEKRNMGETEENRDE